MTVKNNLLTILLIILCGVNSVFSQEWEYLLKYTPYDDERFYFVDMIEMSNGDIAIASKYHYRSGNGDFYSCHPAVCILSPDGKEKARNIFFREGYNTMSYAPYLFENEGSLYALMTYNPDHDYTYFNHFLNYNNPPTDVIIGLYKLDNELNVEESYEYSYPIDTTECIECAEWILLPNEISGNVYMFSAIEDDNNIVAAYIKTDSFKKSSSDAVWGDSLVFMRMNYKGEIINRKSYLSRFKQSNYHFSYRRNHIVKTDSHYVLYEVNSHIVQNDGDGTVSFFDKDFNHITTKIIKNPNINPIYSRRLVNISVARSNHNTTYLSTVTPTINPDYADHYLYEDNRLYEFDDDIENSSDEVSIINYTVRGTDLTRDTNAILKAVDVTIDSSVYYAYNMDIGEMDADSWIVIERLDPNMNTIATLFYGSDNDNNHDEVDAIMATKDGGLIIHSETYKAYNSNPDAIIKKITKFPATAFGFEPDNIEEAHAHGLKLAVAYPNPGGDVMNIRTSLRNATLSVYDIQGRKIHEQEITDEITSIDASRWNSGTYIWKLGTGNGNEVEGKVLETGKWVK